MKIAELFYPKELKEIIADLRTKDDLNKDALKQLNRYITSTLKIIGIASIVFLLFLLHSDAYSNSSAWILIISIILFLPFAVKYDFSKLSNKFAHLYNYGNFAIGICESYGRGYQKGGFSIVVNFELNNVKHRSIATGTDSYFHAKRYKKGESVLVVYDPDNPDINIPFVESMANIFYLRKEHPNI